MATIVNQGVDPMLSGTPQALCINCNTQAPPQSGFTFSNWIPINVAQGSVALYVRLWATGSAGHCYQSWDGSLIRQWNADTNQWDVIQNHASSWGPFYVGIDTSTVQHGASFIVQTQPPIGGGDSNGGNLAATVTVNPVNTGGYQAQFNNLGGGTGQITVDAMAVGG